jgi:hypothetical protein
MIKYDSLIMAVFGLPDAVAVFFLLLPGFVLFRLFLHQGRIASDHDEFEKTYWSVIASVVAILLFSLVSIVATGENPVTDLLSALYGETVGSGVIGFYLVVVLVAVVVGTVSGTVYHRYINQKYNLTKTLEETWEFLNKEATRPIIVHVVTDDGKEILGKVRHAGEEKGLLLRYPKRNDRGTYRPLGKYVYLEASTLSHVYLLTGLKSEPSPTLGSGPLEIDRHERYQDDGAGVSGVLQNNGNEVVLYAEVRVKFYDSDDNLLGVGYDSVRDLGGNERWRFDVVYPGDDPKCFHHYQKSVSDYWTVS